MACFLNAEAGDKGGYEEESSATMGLRLLEAIQERFEQLAHGRQGIGIKQCAHPPAN